VCGVGVSGDTVADGCGQWRSCDSNTFCDKAELIESRPVDAANVAEDDVVDVTSKGLSPIKTGEDGTVEDGVAEPMTGASVGDARVPTDRAEVPVVTAKDAEAGSAQGSKEAAPEVADKTRDEVVCDKGIRARAEKCWLCAASNSVRPSMGSRDDQFKAWAQYELQRCGSVCHAHTHTHTHMHANAFINYRHIQTTTMDAVNCRSGQHITSHSTAVCTLHVKCNP
jgi:hypothetical protein